jgi:hypothetical protein
MKEVSFVLVLKKTCHVSPTASNIVSKSQSETTMCPDVSADVYCQNINNRKHEQSSYLYEMERGGEWAGQRRDRERVCERVGG